MTANMKNKLPPELVTTTCLSGGLAIVLSLTSIVLSILAIVYRQNCSVVERNNNGAEYFLITIIKTYILHDDCPQSLQIDNLTKAESVFILAIIILVFAFINFLTAVTMITVVHHEPRVRNVDVFIYVYLGSSLALFVVDLTLGVHFGMDHEFLKDKLNSNSAGLAMNYESDMIRLGALLMMSTALKGYIGHAVNIVLLVLLAFYVVRDQRTFNELDHSIHKLSVLRAFEPIKRVEEPWSPLRREMYSYSRGTSMNGFNNEDEIRQGPLREAPLTDISSPQKRFEDPWVPQPHRNEIIMGHLRGGQTNPAFINDGQRAPPVKESSISDRSLDRSHSWLHSSGAGMGSRPFSYLEDRQRQPAKSPATPATEPQWRRDAWATAPPVPDPDYSPPPRKLKSALKSNYV